MITIDSNITEITIDSNITDFYIISKFSLSRTKYYISISSEE